MPDGVKLLKLIPFKEDEKIGNAYHQPVLVSMEQGFTHAAASAGAFALNAAVPAVMQDAQVGAYQILLRSSLDYESAARAASSKAAFVKATELLVTNMKMAATKRSEIGVLYGQSGLGIVASTSANGSDLDITFTAASFAPGIWIGSESMKLDVYNGDSQINTNAAVVVKATDIDNKKITVSGNATDLGNIAGTHTLYFYGAYGKEMAGLDKIITNTGTLFNISATTYNVWKGNSYGAGSATLSLAKISKAISKAANRGLEEKTYCFVSNTTWADLMTDMAALRKFDASYSNNEMQNGSRFIKFFAQTGEIEIVPSIYVKEGEAFIFPKTISRIGSTDVTFNIPGMSEQFFLHLPSNAGYELRVYSAFSVFCPYPARMVKITDIVNNS